MSRVLNVVLTHQPAAAVARMAAWWRDYGPSENLLVVFNGSQEDFAAIAHPHKVRVDDARLRTRRHQQERQSYTGVMRAAAQWLAGRDFTHLHLVEYDQVPLTPGFNDLQLQRLEAENADVLGFELVRVDRTNHVHYLYHAGLPGFAEHWAAISVRRDPGVVLSIFGSGSFWTRAAWEAVAAPAEPFPIYLEIYLPTLAHHLGYRVRDWGEQVRFIRSLGDFTDEIEAARRAGAWTLHPVKSLWTR